MKSSIKEYPTDLISLTVWQKKGTLYVDQLNFMMCCLGFILHIQGKYAFLQPYLHLGSYTKMSHHQS